VNGAVVQASVSFPGTGAWTTWRTVALNAPLKAGTNKVRLTATGQSGANLDYLRVEPAGATSTATLAARAAAPDTEKWRVYPNPASGSFTIEVAAAAAASAQVSIMDLSGRTVRSFRYALDGGETDRQHSTEGLQNGVYLIRIESATQEVTTHRLLIAR
jgi:hypothetical protein